MYRLIPVLALLIPGAPLAWMGLWFRDNVAYDDPAWITFIIPVLGWAFCLIVFYVCFFVQWFENAKLKHERRGR